MYDPDTTHLISNAPKLRNLKLATLPDQLTSAYAEIVANRIRLREDPITKAGDSTNLISEMQRLASTYEALVSAKIDREDRKSAAFVAGSAHHVVIMATRSENEKDSELTFNSISSEVAAAVLFLIAEASADAAEIAKRIRVPQERTIESTLLRCIKNLAEGRLGAIVESVLPEAALSDAPPQEAAIHVLYAYIFHGLVELARRILGQPSHYSPDDYFDSVKKLAKDDLGELLGEDSGRVLSIYPGPYHLASLLSGVGHNLMGSALSLVVPPKPVNPENWKGLLTHLAKSRPFLWSNHRSAVDSGYLEPGISAAISFPTGAGKSTLSELKIAAAIARSEKSVFLAPTLTLVEQTAKSLEKSFPDASIQAEERRLLSRNR